MSNKRDQFQERSKEATQAKSKHKQVAANISSDPRFQTIEQKLEGRPQAVLCNTKLQTDGDLARSMFWAQFISQFQGNTIAMLAAHFTAASAALTRTLLKTTWHLVPWSSPSLLATGNKKRNGMSRTTATHIQCGESTYLPMASVNPQLPETRKNSPRVEPRAASHQENNHSPELNRGQRHTRKTNKLWPQQKIFFINFITSCISSCKL